MSAPDDDDNPTVTRSLSEGFERVPAAIPAEGLTVVDPAYYELLGERARGGLGRILEARDRRTGRVVAVKQVLRPDPDTLRRFAREALLTANLQHPSIVPVYEVGRWSEGDPFFAMMLVKGRSLDDLIDECKGLPARLALLPHLIDVAEALAYAHGEQVIHRDLKPANVLVGAYGETVVIDWGLARDLTTRIEDAPTLLPVAAEAAQTVAGSVLGTPAYMPPEQARGEVVDARADVYAVGAMLHHLLAGIRPYAEEYTAEAVLARTLEGPPRPLAELCPELPPELVAIAERAMARAPSDRYPTARGLAEDLRRFATGQLVQAHRYTLGELVVRWIRRHRALVVTGLVSLVALGATGAYSVLRIAAERDEAARQRTVAVRAQGLAERRLGVALEEFGRQSLVAGDVAQAMTFLAGSWEHRPEASPTLRFLAGRTRDALAPLVAVAPAHSATTLWAGATPDGALLLSAGLDRTVRAWDLRARRLRWSHPGPVYARLSPDGTRVACVDTAGVLAVYAAADGSVVARTTFAASEETLAIAWSPDGARLAVGGRAGTLGLWDRGLAVVGAVRPLAHTGRVLDLRFSPDGALLASAGEDGTAIVWDPTTATPRARLAAHQGRVNSVAWLGPDRLVTGGNDGAVIVWDPTAGEALRTLPAGAAVYRVAVDPARNRIAAAVVDPAALVWDADTGAEIARLGGHRGSANEALFVGPQLVTTDEAGAVRRWDIDRAAVVGSLPAEGLVFSVTASHGHLVVAGEPGRIRVVRDAPDATITRLVGHRARMRQIAFDPTGNTLFTASNDGTARAWDAATGAQRFVVGAAVPAPEQPPLSPESPPPANPYGLRTLSLTDDGLTLATAAEDGTVALWNARTGASLGRLDGHVGRVRDVTFSPDGATVLTAGADGTARIWDRSTRRERRRVALPGALQGVRLDPTGRRVVVLGEDEAVSIWDTATGARIDPGTLAPTRIVDLRFTRDGHLITVQPDGVRLIDPITAAEVRTLMVGMVFSVEVSPDGGSLFFGTSGGEATLISAADGARIRTWRAHESLVVSARFRPDGALLATLGTDRIVRIWEASSARLLAASPVFPSLALYLRWSPDGRRLAVAGVAPEAWVWQVAPDPGNAAAFARRARCASPWALDGTALVSAPPDPGACDDGGSGTSRANVHPGL